MQKEKEIEKTEKGKLSTVGRREEREKSKEQGLLPAQQYTRPTSDYPIMPSYTVSMLHSILVC